MEPNRKAPPEAATEEPAFLLPPIEPEDAPPEDYSFERRDAFTPARKAKFLDALTKTGCIFDACRKIGVSRTTAYNHQRSDPDFRRQCDLAVHMSGTSAELIAWERAVVGVEEEVIQYGKIVGTRLRRSDSLLRFLLQGAKPKKYGPRPGFTRKRLLAHERKQIEKEVRAELDQRWSFDDAMEALETKLTALGYRIDEAEQEDEAAGLPRSGDRQMQAGDIGWPENVAVSVCTLSTLSTSPDAPAEPGLPWEASDD